MNRLIVARPTESADPGEAGRSIVEAVLALALIAIAVTSWGRMSTTAARVEATADHREVALEIASNSLERLRTLSWESVAVDPASSGAVRRFEGHRSVHDPAGVDAEVTEDRDGRQFVVTTHVTEGDDPSWRNAVVIVTWPEGERTVELRLDSAMRRPDPGAGG